MSSLEDVRGCQVDGLVEEKDAHLGMMKELQGYRCLGLKIMSVGNKIGKFASLSLIRVWAWEVVW